MTILVSSVSPSIIVMLTDSVVTTTHFQEEGGSYDEYNLDSKSYPFPGNGCITTWGDRTNYRFGQYMYKQKISPLSHSVQELKELVYKYISDEYSKEDELGFHIGGFDRAGNPSLFHVFWGYDRPRPPDQIEPTLHCYDHSDSAFLYNGRNDLADVVINALEAQIRTGKELRFNINSPIGRISMCDFIARFASEITPQVGPPFIINLIFPDNTIDQIKNQTISPINLQSILSVFPKLCQTTNSQMNAITELDDHLVDSNMIYPPEDPRLDLPTDITEPGTINISLNKKNTCS